MTRLVLLAALATSTRAAWPRLDEALANYPAIHARETARIKAGDKSAKFVLVVCYHGLGNRHHALVSAFALALSRNAALYVDWPDQRCNKWAQAGDAAACEASGLEDLFWNMRRAPTRASQRTATWTTSTVAAAAWRAATVAATARARSGRNAMSGAEFFEREAELVTVGVEN